jgi:hypothetical protein
MSFDLVFKLLQRTEKTDMVTTSLSFIVQGGNDAKIHSRDTSTLLHKNTTSRENNE